MALDDVTKLTEELERQELEVSNYFCIFIRSLIESFQAPNGIATPQLYEKLLALYLYQNDLLSIFHLKRRLI